jgi:hypothetical protein
VILVISCINSGSVLMHSIEVFAMETVSPLTSLSLLYVCDYKNCLVVHKLSFFQAADK